jgi:hypothetical protein
MAIIALGIDRRSINPSAAEDGDADALPAAAVMSAA